MNLFIGKNGIITLVDMTLAHFLLTCHYYLYDFVFLCVDNRIRIPGERPFKCVLCGKTFSRSTILKAHEKTHYPKYARKFLSPSPVDTEEESPHQWVWDGYSAQLAYEIFLANNISYYWNSQCWARSDSRMNKRRTICCN